MAPIYIIYGFLATIVLVSIILGIQNWISLCSLNSLISSLESEIEKKGREFDIIRKERNSMNLPRSSDTDQPSDMQEMDHRFVHRGDSSDEIEVVRNVRSEFYPAVEYEAPMGEQSFEQQTQY
ncbi:MAG: hypothetical protein ACOC4C_04345, partial [Fibrobacterota bacterium]